MLPSMPLINLNSQDSECIQFTDNSGKDKCTNMSLSSNANNLEVLNRKVNPVAQILPNNETTVIEIPSLDQGCEDELVLLANSTSSGDKRKMTPACSVAKKKRKTDTLQVSKNGPEDSAAHFAECYFFTLRSVLDDVTLEKFISTLLEYETMKWSRIKLYNRVKLILTDQADLAEQFLGFLLPHEALECGKMYESDFITRAWNLFRCIEPTQLNKMINILEQLVEKQYVTLSEVEPYFKSLFKSQPQLAKCLLSLFPSGPPLKRPEEEYEKVIHINIAHEQKNIEYEFFKIPEDSVKSCSSSSCLCACHSSKIKELCASCNIKFLNGRIYVKRDNMMIEGKVEFSGHSASEMQKKLNPDYTPVRDFETEKTPSKGHKGCAVRREKKNSIESSKVSDLKISETEQTSAENKLKYCSNKGRLSFSEPFEEVIISEKDVYSLNDDLDNFDTLKDECPSSCQISQSNFDSDKEISKGTHYKLLSPKRKKGRCKKKADTSEKLITKVMLKRISEEELIIEPTQQETHETLDAHINEHPNIDREADYLERENRPIDILVETEEESTLRNFTDEPDENQESSSYRTEINTCSEPSNIVDSECCKTEEESVIKQEPFDFDSLTQLEDCEAKEPCLISEIKVEQDEHFTDCQTPFEENFSVMCDHVRSSVTISKKTSWTREEDKVILEAFQKEIGTEHTFTKISSLMPNRSVYDIQNRFQELIRLLEKIANVSHDK